MQIRQSEPVAFYLCNHCCESFRENQMRTALRGKRIGICIQCASKIGYQYTGIGITANNSKSNFQTRD